MQSSAPNGTRLRLEALFLSEHEKVVSCVLRRAEEAGKDLSAPLQRREELEMLRACGYRELEEGMKILDAMTERVMEKVRSLPEAVEGLFCLGGDPRVEPTAVLCVSGIAEARELAYSGVRRALGRTLRRYCVLDGPSRLPAEAFVPGGIEITEMEDSPASAERPSHAPGVLRKLFAAAWGIAGDLESGQSVLVHCAMGLSRSVSLALCALMLVLSRRVVRPRTPSRLFAHAAWQLVNMRRYGQGLQPDLCGKFTNIGSRHLALLLAFARAVGETPELRP